MKKIIILTSYLTFGFYSYAQTNTIPPAENLVIENIPSIPTSIVSEVKNYTEYRGASLAAWHPTKKEMIISTRFANSNQLHYVKMAGGARTQITFFDEPVGSANFQPVIGNYFLFTKDIGGNEFSQIFRFDLSNKKVSMLTDGKRSQNGGIHWNKAGTKIVYASTKRNGQDRDIYKMDPLDPSTESLVTENTGGGWGVSDWSEDESKLLIQEYLSVNESRLYLMELKSGIKTRLLPEKDERTTYSGVCFTKDGKGVYVLTNKENEFNRLAYLELSTKKLNYITSSITWNIESATLSPDGRQLAFVSNENGMSKMYILEVATQKYEPVTGIPSGIIEGLDWSGDSKSLGLTLSTYNASSDVFEYSLETKKLIRWTESELGGLDISTMQEPELITWNSFDGKMISGYLYKASSKFEGKRPVIISIHGGPEGQSRPGFQGRLNYYLNELGISIIYPNVRGSTGYGKTFVDLDNGFNREESVVDIGALLVWISKQNLLDKERVMVMGGSYGGYMSLAVSTLYSDKIRCAIDVVGISNFNTFLKNTEAYRRDLRRVEYGDERDPKMAEFFEKISPLNNSNQIKKPLFIVQGGNDPRVPASEAIQMKEKIKENGGTVWFLMAKDEGHGFRKKNNIDYQFYATIAFIKQYLVN
jgi:dipeptidyl aminopeptidase/acylaminoacyl peptidase